MKYIFGKCISLIQDAKKQSYENQNDTDMMQNIIICKAPRDGNEHWTAQLNCIQMQLINCHYFLFCLYSINIIKK